MINDLDAQLRDMFAIHRDLFDEQEAQLRARTEKRSDPSERNSGRNSVQKQYDRMGKYASNLHRSRMRANRGSDL
jgi:hypothetical protein